MPNQKQNISLENEKLIIRLIVQDIKHNQLVQGLSQLELDSDGHYELEIVHIVSSLMGIPEGGIHETWGNTYDWFMEQSTDLPVSTDSHDLYRLAEECYHKLIAVGH